MKNRFIRLAIYFVVGTAIGVGVGYFQKQQKIDQGVVELTPDEVREENIEIPSRIEDETKIIDEKQSLKEATDNATKFSLKEEEKREEAKESDTINAHVSILTPMPE